MTLFLRMEIHWESSYSVLTDGWTNNHNTIIITFLELAAPDKIYVLMYYQHPIGMDLRLCLL